MVEKVRFLNLQTPEISARSTLRAKHSTGSKSLSVCGVGLKPGRCFSTNFVHVFLQSFFIKKEVHTWGQTGVFAAN